MWPRVVIQRYKVINLKYLLHEELPQYHISVGAGQDEGLCSNDAEDTEIMKLLFKQVKDSRQIWLHIVAKELFIWVHLERED